MKTISDTVKNFVGDSVYHSIWDSVRVSVLNKAKELSK